jgi:RNA polymerase sigma-70 factor, ECF subfamily
VLPKDNLVEILDGCKKGVAECQKGLYELLYGYTLNICLRYASTKEDALEIMQDGFIKIFRKIGGFTYPPAGDELNRSFRSWVKKIMTYTAIDHLRKNGNHFPYAGGYQEIESITMYYTDNFGYSELIGMVRQLPLSYRWVFNLYVIDGYSHKEIAALLKISESTSRSNLAKAKEHLRQMLKKTNEEVLAKYN